MRYIGKHTDLYPTDSKLASVVDAIIDQVCLSVSTFMLVGVRFMML